MSEPKPLINQREQGVNLKPARAMGMTTIWLKTDAPWGKHGPLMDVAEGDIDHETDNLAQFLRSIRI